MPNKPKNLPDPDSWEGIPYSISFIRRELSVEEKVKWEEERAARTLRDRRFEALSPRGQHFHTILNAMLDKLHAAGVDVSYFPDTAWDVLLDTAEELDNL